MICPTCHASYSQLVCPNCTARRARQGYLERYRELLPAIVQGKILLKTAVAAMGRRHLELYGDPGHALCGETLNHKHRRSQVEYDSDQLHTICPSCRRNLDELMTAVPS